MRRICVYQWTTLAELLAGEAVHFADDVEDGEGVVEVAYGSRLSGPQLC